MSSIGPETPVPYPVNLVLSGRRVLVVGGGTVALRKVQGLLASGAAVTVVAPAVVDELAALAVTLERRPYRPGEAGEGYRLVVTATDQVEVNQMVHDDADRAEVWVNAADDPARCTFTLPAVVRRGTVQLTASTGGASPALSAWLRARLEQEFGAELAAVAVALAERRRLLQQAGASTETVDWAPIIDEELDAARARQPSD
jgi:precorrin-2 dehydrogenase / sirohydrochlorin ferrochelatase